MLAQTSQLTNRNIDIKILGIAGKGEERVNQSDLAKSVLFRFS